jgi:hypothetical protein
MRPIGKSWYPSQPCLDSRLWRGYFDFRWETWELMRLVFLVLPFSSYTNALEVAEVEEAVYYSNRAACEYINRI